MALFVRLFSACLGEVLWLCQERSLFISCVVSVFRLVRYLFRNMFHISQELSMHMGSNSSTRCEESLVLMVLDAA